MGTWALLKISFNFKVCSQDLYSIKYLPYVLLWIRWLESLLNCQRGKWTHFLTCKCLLLIWKSRATWSMILRLLQKWTSIHNIKMKKKKKKHFSVQYLCHCCQQFQDCQKKKKNKLISLNYNAKGEVSFNDWSRPRTLNRILSTG